MLQISSLNGAYFLDDQTFWIFGIGAIYKTVDGGRNWIPQRSGGFASYTGGQFVDDQNGWMGINVNGSGVIRTANGGETWEDTEWMGGFGVYGISFIDAQRGWPERRIFCAGTINQSRKISEGRTSSTQPLGSGRL